MLVLTRQIGQTIVIGEEGEIKISILGKQGNKVRVGVDAPIDIAVDREEVFKAKQEDKKATPKEL